LVHLVTLQLKLGMTESSFILGTAMLVFPKNPRSM
jgi:hypothetical protein